MAAAARIKMGNMTGTVIRSGFGIALVLWDSGAKTTVEITLLKEIA